MRRGGYVTSDSPGRLIHTMELWTDVVVKGKVSVSGSPLKGLRGRIVDRPGPDPDPDHRYLVRFPPTGRSEFFAWIKASELRELEVA